MTIPRLELRAALLASQLLHTFSEAFDLPAERSYAWTDARIVLHWLRSTEPTGNSLVDNYVEHTREFIPATAWRHVPTQSNPADSATRGADLASLGSDSMWWHGPEWLTESPAAWPPDLSGKAPDLLESAVCCVSRTSEWSVLEKFSSLRVLLRVVALILRWRRNPRRGPPRQTHWRAFTVSELDNAYLSCTKLSQDRFLATERDKLHQNQSLPANHGLRHLSVFLDRDDVLRVGGRLYNSSLSFRERHPVILSGRCPLATLVIDWAHQRALHGGFRATYAYATR